MASITQSSIHETLLMRDEEYQTSQQFQSDYIYPQIVSDWYDKHNPATNKSIMEDWSDYASRFVPSVATCQKWEELHREHQVVPSEYRDQKEKQRIQKSILQFHQEMEEALSTRKKPLNDNQIAHMK